jgi:hypothetical protein
MAVTLEKIAALAQQLLQYESRIEAVKSNLKQLEATYRRISENELPEAMDAAEVSEFRMTDGRRITVGDEYHAGIPKAKEQEAFEWLRTNGFDGIIKRELSVKFGKGDDDKATELNNELCARYGDHFSDKEAIHHSTLKAFLRELVEEGVDVPLDLFGAHIIRRAKVAGAS